MAKNYMYRVEDVRQHSEIGHIQEMNERGWELVNTLIKPWGNSCITFYWKKEVPKTKKKPKN